MKKEKDILYDVNVQKILNKLISEETIIGGFLAGCVVAACPSESEHYAELFHKIASCRNGKNCKNLVEWAIANDYDVPFKFKDIEKFSDPKLVKLFNTLKNGLTAKEYLDNAIQVQHTSIESYEKMQEKDIPYDLQCILLQNMYNEQIHLEQLISKSYAFDAGVDMINA